MALKFPKNRANLYLVERKHYSYSVVIGAFSHVEDADNFRAGAEQEWLEKVGELTGIDFEVSMTTFYG